MADPAVRAARSIRTWTAIAERARREVAATRPLHPRSRGRRPSRTSSPATSASAHAVGVANGTDALTIALRALGVGPGDDVVVPSFTFYATAEAIAATRRAPGVLRRRPGDVLRHRRDGRAGADAAHEGDRAGAPVRQPRAGRELLSELGLPVLEDAAQAAGADAATARKAGALGDAATFSFFPSKNLPCLGDGGAIVTTTTSRRARARRCASTARATSRRYTEVGYNSRLDAIQAGVLRVLLPELDGWNAGAPAGWPPCTRRPGLASSSSLRRRLRGGEPVYHLYVVAPRARRRAGRTPERGRASRRAATTACPVHRQPAMSGVRRDATFRAPSEVARTNLALPMGPVCRRRDVEHGRP